MKKSKIPYIFFAFFAIIIAFGIKFKQNKSYNNLTTESLRQASDLNDKAEDLYNAKKYQESLDLHLKALNIQQEQAPNSLALASSYNNIGIVYSVLKEYKQAINYYEKAIKIYENQAPNSLDEARSYLVIGYAYNDLKEHNKAINYYEKAIKIYENQAPNSSDLASFYNNIGNAYNNLKEYNKGFNYYAKSLGYDGGISDGIISTVGKIISGRFNLKDAEKFLIRKTSNDNFKVSNIIDKYVIFQTFRNYDLIQIAVLKDPDEIYIDQSILKGKYFAIIGMQQFTKVFGGNSEILVLKRIE